MLSLVSHLLPSSLIIRGSLWWAPGWAPCHDQNTFWSEGMSHFVILLPTDNHSIVSTPVCEHLWSRQPNAPPQSVLAAMKAQAVNISWLAFYQQSTKLEVFPHELTKNNIPAYFHAVMQWWYVKSAGGLLFWWKYFYPGSNLHKIIGPTRHSTLVPLTQSINLTLTLCNQNNF